ncbi:dentin sialophosphoprotein-like [Mya arenaria]|uniref:dentin sialophosphoprotein-like n=1 Tax=Mya arenaria TaxID=6604 RepID=UPI0022DF55FD|nr:dentin sialophosphoprotein-like [Mya arenaria]XP_052779672.1 dentin sialophosphoprotein-like [Mya arenaria]XP_052779673.1 dentin sialophosphoprotein-like [Mya arenaria]XP_052779674.1 dentin sialophosphoprotein-like [Mya arenaria]XP_052779675.1 dentin sialophosphoprotein-like [Mya arenaria]XP_052779676.1 dentin sialophosphoprotein-like [Mya arenaria]
MMDISATVLSFSPLRTPRERKTLQTSDTESVLTSDLCNIASSVTNRLNSAARNEMPSDDDLFLTQKFQSPKKNFTRNRAPVTMKNRHISNSDSSGLASSSESDLDHKVKKSPTQGKNIKKSVSFINDSEDSNISSDDEVATNKGQNKSVAETNISISSRTKSPLKVKSPKKRQISSSDSSDTNQNATASKTHSGRETSKKTVQSSHKGSQKKGKPAHVSESESTDLSDSESEEEVVTHTSKAQQQAESSSSSESSDLSDSLSKKETKSSKSRKQTGTGRRKTHALSDSDEEGHQSTQLGQKFNSPKKNFTSNRAPVTIKNGHIDNSDSSGLESSSESDLDHEVKKSHTHGKKLKKSGNFSDDSEDSNVSSDDEVATNKGQNKSEKNNSNLARIKSPIKVRSPKKRQISSSDSSDSDRSSSNIVRKIKPSSPVKKVSFNKQPPVENPNSGSESESLIKKGSKSIKKASVSKTHSGKDTSKKMMQSSHKGSAKKGKPAHVSESESESTDLSDSESEEEYVTPAGKEQEKDDTGSESESTDLSESLSDEEDVQSSRSRKQTGTGSRKTHDVSDSDEEGNQSKHSGANGGRQKGKHEGHGREIGRKLPANTKLRYQVPEHLTEDSDGASVCLTEEDLKGKQLWLIQAPEEVNMKQLQGMDLTLLGSSVITSIPHDEGEGRQYEVIVRPQTNQQGPSYHSIALHGEHNLVLGHRVQGLIQITDWIPTPPPVQLVKTPPPKHTVPSDLRSSYRMYGSASPKRYTTNISVHEPQGALSRKQKKKKKKKHEEMPTADDTPSTYVADNSFTTSRKRAFVADNTKDSEDDFEMTRIKVAKTGLGHTKNKQKHKKDKKKKT